MSRNDYTVPTRCRHRGGIVDPLGCKACRAIRQPNQPIQSDTGSLDPKSSKTSQFSVIRRFIGIEFHASESYYHSYTVATSGVNRLASQICHNRLFRKKLQQNILPMTSIEVLSLAAHNSSLPSLFYTMTSHRDIYMYEMLRNDYTAPTWCQHRGGIVDPLGCKACRDIR
jgi:hypothetical protein